MPRLRRFFPPEYKAEVVELIRSTGRTVGQVAKELDLTETAVREWVNAPTWMPADATTASPPSSVRRCDVRTESSVRSAIPSRCGWWWDGSPTGRRGGLPEPPTTCASGASKRTLGPEARPTSSGGGWLVDAGRPRSRPPRSPTASGPTCYPPPGKGKPSTPALVGRSPCSEPARTCPGTPSPARTPT